ncbi:MAG: family 43 glycosylhydrolase [Luteolibacter sp.]|uniref:family 43 glycosylhydrolase n=1 Tax=Luteolibacter sp. TaxID=1962973 RepID=UPI003263A3C6
MLCRKILVLLALSPLVAGAANPIFPGADPHAAVFDGTVWIYPTHSEKGKNFWAFKMTPQKTWEKVGPILDLKDVPWLKSEKQRDLGPWAPCIVAKGASYYFYYSVGPQSETRPSRIGVAVGNSPAGPFKDSGKVLLTGGNGFEAIDPMVFEDPQSHKFYLYAGGSAGAKLRVFELDNDMTGLRKEIDVETPKNFTEGAFMHYQGGLYHLTYSHGNWQDTTYSVHHSTSKTPFGPWEYRGVILKSDDHNKGPGHHSIIQIPATGAWYIVYHRWNNRQGDGPYSGGRETAIDKMFHKPDGSIEPVVMTN